MTASSVMAMASVIFAFIVPLVLLILFVIRKTTRAVVVCFFYGFILGYIWEIAHMVAPGPFITLVDPTLQRCFPIYTLYPMVHAVGDAFIFLMSLLLVYLMQLQLDSASSLMVMILFGVSVAVIVETGGNGNYWHYNESVPGNPVMWRLNNGVGYTLWPILEWIIAPIIFWAGALFIFKNERIN